MSSDNELGDEFPYGPMLSYEEAVSYCTWFTDLCLGFSRLTAYQNESDVYELIGFEYDDLNDSPLIVDSLYVNANLAHTLAKHGYVDLWERLG